MTKYLCSLLVGAILVVGGGCLTSNKDTAGPVPGTIDPQATEALQRMCAFMSGVKTFRVDLSGTKDEILPSGEIVQLPRDCRVKVIRPNRLQAEVDKGAIRWSIWYDGKAMTLFDENNRVYAQESVKGTIGMAFDHMADTYDLTMPMADLLTDQTYESLIANVTLGSYLGLHQVGTHACHHLQFNQETVDWQIWIDAGPQPLQRKMVITYKGDEDQPQSVMVLDHWDINPSLPADTGSFKRPTGVGEILMKDLLGVPEEGEAP